MARVEKLKDPYGNLWIISSPAAVKQVVDSDIGPPSATDYIITPPSTVESYLAVTAIHEEENAAACSQEWVPDNENASVTSSDKENPKENDYDGVLIDEVDDEEEEY